MSAYTFQRRLVDAVVTVRRRAGQHSFLHLTTHPPQNWTLPPDVVEQHKRWWIR